MNVFLACPMMLLKCTRAICRNARERCFSIKVDWRIQMRSPRVQASYFRLFRQFSLAHGGPRRRSFLIWSFFAFANFTPRFLRWLP
ncbi:hypothetical protein EUGRSUZ_K00209 [Eucalyptus grandis]|uniref:Uncharacterized protein n=2 Tax=Eucalyptus grandis TaxID=71139 RepID=A0A058ZX27_EUCGR|nr:hypothetical protein EUGRSUZ_K00209 [Eucalyptus grandis]